MKCLLCKLCFDLVAMKKEIRTCQCGNVKGHYIDLMTISIDVTKGDWGSVRIVGIANDFLQNEAKTKRHGNPDPNGKTFFDMWGSDIIIVGPYIPNDVRKMDESRFPEVKFWYQEDHKV